MLTAYYYIIVIISEGIHYPSPQGFGRSLAQLWRRKD